MEKVRQSLLSKEGLVPSEYALFQFCRMFHKLPHEVREMPPSQYELWRNFLIAERDADTIREERARLEAMQASTRT